MSINYQKPASGTKTRLLYPSGIQGQDYQMFGEILRQLMAGGQSALGTPMGILGPTYNALFGQNSTGDYLGARQALQDTLSGKGLDQMVQTSYNQLRPTAMQAISEGGSALRSAAGPLGLRFSTDLMGQQTKMGEDLMNQLQDRSLAAAVPLFQQRAQSAAGIFDLIGRLGAEQSPLAAIMKYITSFMPGGSFGGGGGGGFQGTYSGPYGKTGTTAGGGTG